MVRLKGLDKFLKHIDGMDKRLSSSVKQAVTQNALEMEAKAKNLVPVDTGHLRRSISTEVKETSNSISAEVGTNVEYGIYVEFGTSTQPEQPFMNPAFQSQKTQFEKDMKEALKKGVDGK